MTSVSIDGLFAPYVEGGLERASLPALEEHVRNAVAGLAERGRAAGALVDRGWVPADVLFAQTLALLDGQRSAQPSQSAPARESASEKSSDSAVAGGVWVREQLTIHQPIRIGATFSVEGEIARSYAKRGRLYTVSTSRSHDADGALLVSSCTTGLVQYRADPDLADGEQGTAAQLARPGPDPTHAYRNPALGALRAARTGDRLDGPKTEVTLEMMRARDGGRSRNPIHTEPEEARRAGLSAPIAGGPQVFAFAQELLLEAWGPEALIWGAHIDVRWRAPVHAGESVLPHAVVERADATGVEVELAVERGDVAAMVGRVTLPVVGSGGAAA